MKRRNKYLLTIPNCPQKRSTANIGKIMIRIFSFVENHETEKKEHKKITINIYYSNFKSCQSMVNNVFYCGDGR